MATEPALLPEAGALAEAQIDPTETAAIPEAQVGL